MLRINKTLFTNQCIVCSVNMGDKGMEALINLGAGDMRRTLNILQVSTSLLLLCMLSPCQPHNTGCFS